MHASFLGQNLEISGLTNNNNSKDKDEKDAQHNNITTKKNSVLHLSRLYSFGKKGRKYNGKRKITVNKSDYRRKTLKS